MKKIIGWLIVISCSLFILIFVLSFLFVLPGLIDKYSDTEFFSGNGTLITVQFLILIGLFLLGLRKGLRMVRNTKKEEIVENITVLDINLNGRIEYKDYRNLLLNLNYKKPILIIVPFFLFMLFFNMLENGFAEAETFQLQLIFVLAALFILAPILSLYQIKKIYKNNKILSEHMAFSINNESIRLKGETIDANQKWAHFSKIKETKGFFMLYQDKIMATILDKKMFSENEIREFRNFLKSLPIEKILLA